MATEGRAARSSRCGKQQGRLVVAQSIFFVYFVEFRKSDLGGGIDVHVLFFTLLSKLCFSNMAILILELGNFA